MGATARFAAVVKAAGQPEAITLWTDPKQNQDFMRAVKQHRVMTVKQSNIGTGKDFGQVGFLREPLVTYLVFPKSLHPFEGKRIVGINYTLLKERPNRPAKRPKAARVAKPRRQAPKTITKPEPKDHPFRVTLRRRLTTTETLEVQAKTKAEAKKKALEKPAQQHAVDGDVETKVVAISPR